MRHSILIDNVVEAEAKRGAERINFDMSPFTDSLYIARTTVAFFSNPPHLLVVPLAPPMVAL